MCLAQALATSGDLGGARSELERLLAANNRDPHLLKQLSKLAEEEGDIESAARYQKQLIELAPSDEELSRLAQLYARSGELEEAQAVWSKMASGKGGTFHVYQAIDNLLVHQKPQPVVEITEAMVRKDPRDWEALYREGAALAALQKPEEATQAVPGAARPDDRRRRKKHRRQGPCPQPAAPGQQCSSLVAHCSRHRESTRTKNRHGVRDPPRLQPRRARPNHCLVARGFWTGAHGRPGLALEFRATTQSDGLEPDRRNPQRSREGARRRSRTLGLVLPVPDALRQRGPLRGGPHAQPGGRDRSDRSVGLPSRHGGQAASAWAGALF